MAKSSTSFKKGQSGNPSGAPPKNRALTQILEAAGDNKIAHGNKQLSDWFGVAKFLYAHIDGPPKAELDVTSGGEPIAIAITKMDVDEL
jgi:hypothetical protein